MTSKSMRELWQDYLFLSKELHKFVSVEELDLFADILRQRGVLSDTIRQTADKEGYIKSAEGQDLLKQIDELDKTLAKRMLKERNLLQKNMELSAVYDGFIGDNVAVGTNFDSGNQ